MVSAVILVNTSVLGSSATTATYFKGGRTCLVLSANQYGPSVFLQLQTASQAWAPVNGTTYSADQVTAYDLPAGQYRMISSGSSIGLAATLVNIPYG